VWNFVQSVCPSSVAARLLWECCACQSKMISAQAVYITSLMVKLAHCLIIFWNVQVRYLEPRSASYWTHYASIIRCESLPLVPASVSAKNLWSRYSGNGALEMTFMNYERHGAICNAANGDQRWFERYSYLIAIRSMVDRVVALGEHCLEPKSLLWFLLLLVRTANDFPIKPAVRACSITNSWM